MPEDITNKKYFSARDVYSIIILVIGLAGIYFPMRAEINALKVSNAELKKDMDYNDLKTRNLRLDVLQKDIEEFDDDFSEFVDDFNTWAREGN